MKSTYLIILILMMLPIGLSLSQSVNGIITGGQPPSTPNIVASKTPTVFATQTEVFTATANGGFSPFTYNFQVVNTITGAQVTNLLITSSQSSYGFSWFVGGIWIGNTIKANVTITDALGTTVNSVYTPAITIEGGSASGATLLPQEIVVDSYNWLALILFIFAMLFIGVRFASWGQWGTRMVVLDVFSAMFMIFAFFFTVFSPVSTTYVNATYQNLSSSGNVITNTTLTTQTPYVPVNSNGFIMLTAFTSSYLLFMFILALYDFIRARGNVPV